jgi:oxygen-independent coproporphyrinogen-3 oxidase
MAGIYIHIPFCKQACHYCNFHFSTSVNLKNDFLHALLKEAEMRKDYANGEKINTVYFGGGTPSLLRPEELNAIMQKIFRVFDVAKDAEITFEANPDDISFAQLLDWKMAGVNRLSIGIQSFFKEDLEWMNRAHDEKQAMDAIVLSKSAGIDNISIDLIYGTPTLSDARWMQNLQTATELGIPHLSCYALTVEPRTALDSLIRNKKLTAVNNEDQARQFLLMTDYLATAGYEHYEISNFALPGKRSRHNSSYWSGEKYIGLGPSAHSFNGSTRQWNVSNNALYISALNRNQVPFEEENLTASQRFNEYVMTSLRTMEGTDINHALEMFGSHPAATLTSHSAKFIEKGWMENKNNRLVLTREGKLFADGISSDLFLVD